MLKEITKSFYEYLINHSLDPKDNPKAVQVKEARSLPKNSLVLEGIAIFNLFFEGTNLNYYNQQGQAI